ncbi:hypothetical protein ACE6ED_13335 [Paenibacillus sp. CN-4]|uniref:hypothetical protein n=1 Tax=Paenibacillus nanchangensis TaxID=3348343 RepID=UPI00397E1B96
MKYQVNRGFVKHEGVLYPRGSFFNADPEEVHYLIDGKFIATAAAGGVEEPPALPPEEEELPTPEEFGKLKSTEQKELLLELGIDPESGAEGRQKQYAEYYEQAE